MDKSQLQKAIEEVRKNSTKRNFKQSFDLIINLKNLDLKKPEHQIELFIPLPNSKGKPVKICAFIGPELLEQAKNCNKYIIQDEFALKYVGQKKVIKKLAKEYDFFIAQANIMPAVAKTFGGVLGPRRKMPNPKAGCIVPPNANLKLLVERLQKTVRVSTKIEPVIKAIVGTEEMKDEQIIDNIMTIYNQIIHSLPEEENNIKNVLIKLTMSKPVKVEAKKE